MLSVWAAARALLMPVLTVNLVAAAALALLLGNPLNLAQTGFQFSFLIVLTLDSKGLSYANVHPTLSYPLGSQSSLSHSPNKKCHPMGDEFLNQGFHLDLGWSHLRSEG